MNGHPRDQIDTDLDAGRPTISPIADPLAVRVARLMSGTEAARLYRRLEARANGSPGFAAWIRDPTHYLSDFDSATATAIEEDLGRLLQRMVRRAKERGWEVAE